MADAEFIVVGAGAAGCLLANRLSANPANRVILLEAGGRDSNPLISVPLLAGYLYYVKSLNWDCRTEPEPGLGGRSLVWPRGRVLGGSTAINGMMYMRGHRADYDGWAELGLDGWGYEDVLPLFRAFERNASHPDGEHWHGRSGELFTEKASGANPLYAAWLQAAAEAGLPLNEDHNGAEQEGLGLYDFNIDKGRRVSAATAFLRPIEKRPNLRIVTRAQVTGLNFDGTSCTGVTYQQHGRSHHIAATREVALCGGAINSPQLLQLSGIGDPAQLQAHGIAVRLDRPQVGQNLQDHLSVYIHHRCLQPVTLFGLFRPDRAALAIGRAMLTGTGPGASLPLEAGGFLRTRTELAIPDIHMTFIPGLSLEATRAGQREHGFLTSFYQLRPHSRGHVTLRSADPLAPARVFANYLAHDEDRRVMRDGIGIARRIAEQSALDRYRGAEISPGLDRQTEEALDDWVSRTAGTTFHPVGTCRMGADDDAVLDAALRVRGIGNLRVVDASAMPLMIGGNTSVPTMMIAEKAGRLMLGA
ncbi:choline dehydrogenase [Acidisoma cellulosilytica]|uniref:Choline dehydrogenase n=1 Tax=Acidisoma cellulosilyticum TaxID=2802395 RepID=A0A963Z3L7_9PROT|nr:choline dehydrogenase [Acidisoma cellulosilyticum]MCB8881405.1 choline dehydrogenase [Acidisoma cellulosilyticum]